jgi:hypothetical protein
MISEVTQTTRQYLVRMWDSFFLFLPKLIGALFIFIIGWFFASFIGRLMAEIVVVLASVEIFGFRQFAGFLTSIIAWLPNLMVAILIFVVAVILTDILEKLIKASVKKMGIGYVGLIGTAARWSIYIFALLAILDQLGVATTIVEALVTGFVGMVAIAFGLAFGLGGKDAASNLIEDFKRKIS